MKSFFKSIGVTVVLVAGCGIAGAADEFVSRFPADVQRPWAGPQYWTNPMEDWRISGGRLEVVRSGVNRNVHVLTRQLGPQKGSLRMSVVVGRTDGLEAVDMVKDRLRQLVGALRGRPEADGDAVA